jgi:hypothetical protein
MRWRTNLSFRVLKPGETVVAEDRVRIEFTPTVEDGWLVLRYRSAGAALVGGKDPWYYDSHVVFLFDWDHDHRTRHLLALGPDGAVLKESRELACVGEDEAHMLTAQLPPAPRRIDSRPGELRVDLEGVPGPVVGISAEAVLGERPTRGVRLVPNRAPLEFADLYLRNAAVVRGIDFGSPEWKMHHIRVATDVASPHITTRFMDRSFETTDPGRVPVFFDRRAKWTNGMRLDAALEMTVDDWRASFPVSFDHGLIPRDRLGEVSDRTRPAPDDPDFVAKIERYYLAMLPDFRRVREDGYWLVAEGHRIDLLGGRVVDELCALIRSIFDDPADALCAISVLIGSSAGVLHSAPRAHVAAVIDPEDQFALGAGFCGDVANLGGLMAERIAPRYGLEWRSYRAGLDGHVVCAIEWAGAFHIIDPMVGKFFYAMDNRRLATLEEMTRVPEISYRVDCFNRAHGHEFYVGRTIELVEFDRPAQRLLRTDG